MKKLFADIKLSNALRNILYAFTSFCFVFTMTEYFFNDSVWGNQSILNLIAFILIFTLFKFSPDKPDKQTKICGVIFSAILATSLIIGKCIYSGALLSSLFFTVKEGLITVVSFYGFFSVLYATFILIVNCLTRCALKPADKIYKIQRFPFLYGILLFLCWLPCYLSYYPGIFAYDIELQTMEALGTISYSRFHPPLHTFI